jgi:hypothetical protein
MHSIQITNNSAIFDHMFAYVRETFQLQYFGGTLPVAPKGEETLTPCTFLNFTDFFLYSCNTITWCKMVSSTNILVHYIEPHLAYSIECRLFNRLE